MTVIHPMADFQKLRDGLTGRRALNIFGLSALVGYCAWWSYWLTKGQFPAAPIRVLSGLPAPSTGCVRSLDSLLHGDFQLSFYWNPFSLPITGLFALSVGWLAVRGIRGKELLLPSCFLPAWVVLLLLAWIAKFMVGPSFW